MDAATVHPVEGTHASLTTGAMILATGLTFSFVSTTIRHRRHAANTAKHVLRQLRLSQAHDCRIDIRHPISKRSDRYVESMRNADFTGDKLPTSMLKVLPAPVMRVKRGVIGLIEALPEEWTEKKTPTKEEGKYLDI